MSLPRRSPDSGFARCHIGRLVGRNAGRLLDAFSVRLGLRPGRLLGRMPFRERPSESRSRSPSPDVASSARMRSPLLASQGLCSPARPRRRACPRLRPGALCGCPCRRWSRWACLCAARGPGRRAPPRRHLAPAEHPVRPCSPPPPAWSGWLALFGQPPRPATAVLAPESREARQSTDGLGCHAANLRARFHRTPGRKIIEQLLEILGSQILVIIIVDLDHGRVAASAEALDLGPGEQPVGRNFMRRPHSPLEHRLDVV